MYTRCRAPARAAARIRVPGLVLVAVAASRAVHDDLGAVHRRFDSLAGGQVTGHVLDALPGLTAAPAEHPYLAAGLLQPAHDGAAERTRAASDQDV
jgi:hypothetical protein